MVTTTFNPATAYPLHSAALTLVSTMAPAHLENFAADVSGCMQEGEAGVDKLTTLFDIYEVPTEPVIAQQIHIGHMFLKSHFDRQKVAEFFRAFENRPPKKGSVAIAGLRQLIAERLGAATYAACSKQYRLPARLLYELHKTGLDEDGQANVLRLYADNTQNRDVGSVYESLYNQLLSINENTEWTPKQIHAALTEYVNKCGLGSGNIIFSTQFSHVLEAIKEDKSNDETYALFLTRVDHFRQWKARFNR